MQQEDEIIGLSDEENIAISNRREEGDANKFIINPSIA
jgi:hypothetical protein